jgi:hypothetical protein
MQVFCLLLYGMMQDGAHTHTLTHAGLLPLALWDDARWGTHRHSHAHAGLLPLALWDDAGWGTVPIEALISFFLLGVEEIGVQVRVVE